MAVSAITSVILAGGKSSRLGRDKAAVMLAGEGLLNRVIRSLSSMSSESLVVTTPTQPLALGPGVRVVTDLYPGKGVLGGIYTGLLASANFHSLVVACDMPFLNSDLLSYMIELCHGFDVVVPRLRGETEPLHAIYSKNCLGPIKGLIDKGWFRVVAFFDAVRVRYVEEAEVDLFDPQRLSFFNINTPADLERAEAILGVKKSEHR